jgi:glycosyltransferase involved in cell wall biosynthesis
MSVLPFRPWWKKLFGNRVPKRKSYGFPIQSTSENGNVQKKKEGWVANCWAWVRMSLSFFMDVAAAVPEAKFVWAGGRPFKALTEGINRIDVRMESATENIQFTGLLDLDKMPWMYAAADVLLFTSYQENCPLAPIEGAASGMPVVFRDIEEYSHLYDYPYLKAGSTDEFISMTRKLMNDRAFYANGLTVSSQLISQFDKETIRKKLISLYDRLNNRIPTFDLSWLS